jgi:hypothetical protein
MKAELQRVSHKEGLSGDVAEIVKSALRQA